VSLLLLLLPQLRIQKIPLQELLRQRPQHLQQLWAWRMRTRGFWSECLRFPEACGSSCSCSRWWEGLLGSGSVVVCGRVEWVCSWWRGRCCWRSRWFGWTGSKSGGRRRGSTKWFWSSRSRKGSRLVPPCAYGVWRSATWLRWDLVCSGSMRWWSSSTRASSSLAMHSWRWIRRDS